MALALSMLTVAMPRSAKAADDLVVGVAAPLSGPYAATGEALKAAADIAAQRLNADAAAAAPALRIVLADDGCDPGTATAAAASLVSQGAAVVVGHPCASAAIAAAKTYAAAGIAFIAAAPRHPDLTRKRAGPTIFRLAGRDDRQGHALGTVVASTYPGKRVAIVHDRTSYARAIADGTRAALVEAGFPPPPEHGIVAGDKDFSTTVAGLVAHRAEVVVFAGFPTEAQALIDQMGARGLAPALVLPDALADPAWTPRPAVPAQALSATVPAAPFARSAAAGDIALALAARRGIEPTPPALAAAVAAAGAIEAWVLAARHVAPADGARIREQLTGEGVATRLGQVAFDDAGDARIPSYAVVRWSGDGWRHERDVPHSGSDATRGGSAGAAGARTIARTTPAPGSRAPPVPVRNPRRLAGGTTGKSAR